MRTVRILTTIPPPLRAALAEAVAQEARSLRVKPNRSRVVRKALARHVAPDREWNDDLGEFEDEVGGGSTP